MRNFSDYLREMDGEQGGDSPAQDFTPVSQAGSGGSSDSLMAAFKAALRNSKPQVEKFLQGLAATDKEVQKALGGAGNDDAYPSDDEGDSQGHDHVVPPSTDQGGGDGDGQ